ncbi:MAG: hypothetical protein DHS20C21_18900 [Gemmatimonadota bacterium]|nr:MAG: hypothetical protein DHS20C21_18900 [Gemmatimonadota bacterium]
MDKGWPLLIALVALLGVGTPAQSAEVALFFDPAYVDEFTEANNTKTALENLGHTVITIESVADSVWAAALATADVVVLPEIDTGTPLADLQVSGAFLTLQNYVLGGGGLIANYDVSLRTQDLLNAMFGFALTTGNPTGASTLGAFAAAGTPFESGPPALSDGDDTRGLTSSTLPGGSRSVYFQGAVTTVALMPAGNGRVVWLGFDWFENPIPTDWETILGSAVTFADEPRARPANVALFFDDVFVDLATEGANMRAALEVLGHNVTPFTGISTAEWTAALTGADYLVLPELEGDLDGSLETGAKDAMLAFVTNGGGMVSTYTQGGVLTLLNNVFGFALSAAGGVQGNRNGAVNGTLFREGPFVLPQSNATDAVLTTSLPAGNRNLYSSGASCTFFSVGVGTGRLFWNGFDWFQGSPIPLPWIQALSCAIDLPAQATIASAPTTGAGADKTVTVALDDETGVTAANLFYRAGGTSAFTMVAMTENPAGSGMWDAVIPGADVTSAGVQFYVESNDGYAGGPQPGNSPSSGNFFNASTTLNGFAVTSLPAGTHQMLGMRLRANDTNPISVFDEFGGTYDNSVWRYGVFNPTAAAYAEPPNAPAASPGQGFWIIAKDATNITTNGQSTDLSGNIAVTLRPGFNQVANPYNFPIDAADVVLPTGVEFNFTSWSGTGYVAGNPVLTPGTGYFLRNNNPANAVIEFPPLGSGVAARTPRIAPGVLPRDAAGWSVRVAAQVGEFTDQDNRLGLREGATDAKDAFDFADAPAPPGPYVSVSFLAADGLALLTDYRASSAEGAVWDVVLRSNRAGETYQVDFTPERELPADWSLVALAGAGAEEVDLLAQPVLTGAVASDAFQRNWQVVAGPADFVDSVRDNLQSTITAFAFSAPRPNPVRGASGATFELQVVRAADALVEVFDAQGRRVQTLQRGPMARGQHSIYWDGTNVAGRPVAAGVYFVKARVDQERQTRKVTILN